MTNPLKGIVVSFRICWSRHAKLMAYAACIIWTASSEFGTYSLYEQRRFRRACASAQSRQNPLLAHTSSESRGTFRQKARSLAPLNGWACAVKVGHDGCLKTQIRLTGLICANKLIQHDKVTMANSGLRVDKCRFGLTNLMLFLSEKQILSPIMKKEQLRFRRHV